MTIQQFKIFDKYDVSGIQVKDPGLKAVINCEPKLILKSYGRNVQKFGQTKVNVIERLMNKLATAGHRGKKHKIQKKSTGKYTRNMLIVLKSFEMIEKKTGFETRATVLGHIQRGGSPTAFDRVLATRFGIGVLDLIEQKKFGYMVSLQGNKIVSVRLEEATGGLKLVPQEFYKLSEIFFG